MPQRTQTRKPTGYFGLPGSFTHEVALKIFAESPLESFGEMSQGFDRLRAGQLGKIVVPFENSVGGAIPDTLDQLILLEGWNVDFTILEQVVYPVHLCLMSLPGADPVRTVYSHFVPMQVAKKWLDAHYPDTARVVVASTSAAAERARSEPGSAAVGNPAAADVYGLRILKRDLAPATTNITRFLVVGRKQKRTPAAQADGTPRRTMTLLRLKNKVGALADALMVLKNNQVNMTQILSRPVRERPGEHQFLIEMDVPPRLGEKEMAAMLADECASLDFLGIYPHRTI